MRKILAYILHEADQWVRALPPKKKVLLLFGICLAALYTVASLTGDRKRTIQFREEKISNYAMPFPGMNPETKRIIDSIQNTATSDTTYLRSE